MHRFYAPPENFKAENITLDADETRHLRDVLRLRAGDEVAAFDGAGREFRCAVETVEKRGAILNIIAEIAPAQPESPLALTLCVALLKGEKFDLVVQKATELGVTRIIPVQTARCDVRLKGEASDGAKRRARWQRIALEAAKQCGRARVPEIAAIMTFQSLFLLPQNNASARFLFSERGGTSFLEPLAGQTKTTAEVYALVGAEGGWADEELVAARAQGWQIITIGGRILRAETAAIVITALLQHRCGDLC